MSVTEGRAESRWCRKAAETQIDGCVQSTRTCWLIQELEHAVVSGYLIAAAKVEPGRLLALGAAPLHLDTCTGTGT